MRTSPLLAGGGKRMLEKDF